MVGPTPAPDILLLLGLGGLYNGEQFTVRAGTSATAGSSSLATCPVTSCRNFARLTGSSIRAELVGALAAEHVRWIYLGDGRLIIENLAGRDVWAGGRAIPDRVEVDLEKGPVEVEFGLGERITASLPGADAPPQDLTPATKSGAAPMQPDPLAATLTVHGSPPRPEDLDPPLRLYPAPDATSAADHESEGPLAKHGPPPPKPPIGTPPPFAPPPAVPLPADAPPGRRRRRSRSSGAMFFSVLLHLVLILGLFSYIASGLVPAPRSLVTEVTVVTPRMLPTATPPNPSIKEPVPSEPAAMNEAELPAIIEDETPAEFADGPGLDDAPDHGVPGVTGGGAGTAIGIGPGGRPGSGFPGGSGGGETANPKPGVQKPLWLALDWLRRHQEEGGSWGGISSLKRCRSCTGMAKREYRIAQTGLATLAFAGAGHTHRSGEFKQTVRSATKFLMDRCGPDGSFHAETTPAADRRMYGQAMAVLALSEVYRQSRSPFLTKVLERGVRFIERAQEPYAGWRYQPDGRSSDTSVTGWQVLALFAAERAGIPVNPATRSGARQWVLSMTENQTYRVGYNRRGRGSLAMTATGLTMKILLGRPSTDPAIRGAFRILKANHPLWPQRGTPPVEGNPPDLYYWYFGTLAMSRKRGTGWKPWRKALRIALLTHQETRPGVIGSWAPIGRWEKIGGRVLATALGALCLEVADGMKTAFK